LPTLFYQILALNVQSLEAALFDFLEFVRFGDLKNAMTRVRVLVLIVRASVVNIALDLLLLIPVVFLCGVSVLLWVACPRIMLVFLLLIRHL